MDDSHRGDHRPTSSSLPRVQSELYVARKPGAGQHQGPGKRMASCSLPSLLELSWTLGAGVTGHPDGHLIASCRRVSSQPGWRVLP